MSDRRIRKAMQEFTEKQRIIQELVPGKQITLAHIIVIILFTICFHLVNPFSVFSVTPFVLTV